MGKTAKKSPTKKAARKREWSAGKVYVIRREAYYYTDEYYRSLGQGRIVGVYTDEAKARYELQQREVEYLRKLDFATVGPTSPFTDGIGDSRDRLHAYLVATFGTSFMTGPEGQRHAEDGAKLPPEATDAQVMRVREISGVRFHVLSVFDSEPVFYRVRWERGHDNDDDSGSPYFFNSYEEAMAHAASVPPTFAAGSDRELAELTDQPELLRSLIETRKGRPWHPDDVVAVNALLKKPMWEIRPLSLDEAEDLPALDEDDDF